MGVIPNVVVAQEDPLRIYREAHSLLNPDAVVMPSMLEVSRFKQARESANRHRTA
jgi:hypothetical protein